MSNEWSTKVGIILEKAVESVKKITGKKVNKARLDLICLMILSMSVSRSVQFGEIADKMETDALEDSNVRRIQRFMSSFSLDYEWVQCLIIMLLPDKAKVRLSIDRTEWKFGEQSHNVLVISAYTHGVGIPIWFECLDNKGGNSSTDDRIYVLLKCIEGLGKERIKCIMGDCEFIGMDWIRFLMEEGIDFYFDIRSNQYFTYKDIRHQISEYMKSRQKTVLNKVEIFGYELGLSLKRLEISKKGKQKEILAIVTNKIASQALSNYRSRWSIEVLFESLKTRGFNLEDTHLKDPTRLRKLFALVSIAFTLCFLVGLALDRKKPIPVKSHGYKAKSFFRNGLDFMRKALKINKKQNILIDISNNVNYIIQFILTLLEYNFFRLKKIVM